MLWRAAGKGRPFNDTPAHATVHIAYDFRLQENDPMNFPDLRHVRQLQKDLWYGHSSRAAVMVGAGFSLNGEALPGTAAQFPDWRQLSRAMFDEIYPELRDEADEDKIGREKEFAQKSALRIASEYEAAFDRQRLESFIHAQIPDAGYQPGHLHQLLLQKLPWKDVFTTNYDTLLERTEVPGRAYQPVTSASGLTTASSPRIIKLHGSLHSETRLIITEEDYRTYQKSYAPFVNTVRQSLIENAFVLIGFSGEDPNFLEWTGWIRDELGVDHAPIYLVGPLSASNMQRSLLDRRGVTPIDLAPLFSGISPTRGIHAAALEWFLRSLLAARPPQLDRWPRSKGTTEAAADFEPPILPSSETEPQEIDPFGNSQGNYDEEIVMKIIDRWRFERNQYPGWLVATNEIRFSLWSRTKPWMARSLLDLVNSWPPPDRLLLYREINWRLEVSMIPLFPDLTAPIESTIRELFPEMKNKTPENPSARMKTLTHVSDAEVGEAWLEMAFALLREARENYASERWSMYWEMIGSVVEDYPQFTDQYHYEHVLWLVWNIERNQAKEALTNWSPSPHAPLAVMWKAGLLAELDELADARSLLQPALQEIRKSTLKAQGQNVGLLSLEGWCTYLLFSVEAAIDIVQWPELYEEFSERWRELEAWACNPQSLTQYFDDVLSETPPVLNRGKKTDPGFDAWGRDSTVTYHMGKDPIEAWLPAFACIRSYEKAGIPMRLPYSSAGREALRNACKWVAPFRGFWSPAILVRAGEVEELTKHGFMDRTQVAAMHPTLAKDLNKWATDALRRELSSLSPSKEIDVKSAQESLLEVLTEVLARLVFKLEVNDMEEAFSLAVELHQQPGIYSHSRLQRSCEPWFRELYEAADDRQLLAWLPELIRFPLQVGNPQTSPADFDYWPDPLKDFPFARVGPAVDNFPSLLTAINEATEWLLERARSASEAGRRKALKRLAEVYGAGLMSDEQQNTLGELLWEKMDDSGMHDLSTFSYFSYFCLPCPWGTDVVGNVKRHILSRTPIDLASNGTHGGKSLNEQRKKERMILELARASKPIVQLNGESKGMVEWSSSETKELWNAIYAEWKRTEATLEIEKTFPYLGHWVSPGSRLQGLNIFLARVVLPNMQSASEDEWNKTLTIFSDAREHGVYLTTALPYVLLHRSGEGDNVNQTILQDLSCGDEKAVEAGAKAVRHWVHLAGAVSLDHSPTAVLDELLRNVVFRRIEGIQTCLNQLTLLLIEKPDSFDFRQINLLVMSLPVWQQAIHLPLSDENNVNFPESQRPNLRARLGWLASALSIWLENKLPGQPEPAEISCVRELYTSDPLPEVRRSFRMVEIISIQFSRN